MASIRNTSTYKNDAKEEREGEEREEEEEEEEEREGEERGVGGREEEEEGEREREEGRKLKDIVREKKGKGEKDKRFLLSIKILSRNSYSLFFPSFSLSHALSPRMELRVALWISSLCCIVYAFYTVHISFATHRKGSGCQNIDNSLFLGCVCVVALNVVAILWIEREKLQRILWKRAGE